jgi:hypothetical protein
MEKPERKEPVHLKQDWTCVLTSKGCLGIYPPKANMPGGKHWKGTEVEVRAIAAALKATRPVRDPDEQWCEL